MTSFVIDAAELNPALKALAPITRGVVKGEPETAGVCEMVYCRATTSGELLMATADLTHKLVAAVTVPLIDFDGELAEFAIGREKLKQIMAIFKPDEEANKPVVVEVARNKVPLRGVEQVITMTEGEIDQSPSSLSFAGAKWEDLPWRETLKSVIRNRLEQQPGIHQPHCMGKAASSHQNIRRQRNDNNQQRGNHPARRTDGGNTRREMGARKPAQKTAPGNPKRRRRSRRHSRTD